MSRTVDERVVQMQFDNKQFESGIQTSLSSIDKLNQSLQMSGSTKGLENIDAAAKKVNMNGLSSAVETVSAKFSALQVVAITALANITNSAVNYGKRIVSSLTIEPITTGFSEYELKMNSVQTIMAGTGEKLETVNKYLEELNAYSDRTIYSFSDMTSNIGKFTNAGVKLEDAVLAIKGVSNVAALSGANAAEASRAMYNFSQALSSGYVKLIDWKSIENANMATVGFKDELIKTALAMGTITDAGDGMYKTLEGHTFNATKNFNDVLQDQWMTTDVLVTTLAKYTDESTELGQKAYAAAQDVKTFSQMMDTLKESAQSGWAQSWEIVAGNFDEAKALWTDVNNVVGEMISSSAKARNEMFQGWKDLGGRKALIDAIANAFHGVMEIIKPISEALKEIFPPATGKQVYDLSVRFKELTENFRNFLTNSEKGKKVLDQIKRTFKGIFASLSIGIQIFKGVFDGFKNLLTYLAPAGDGLLDFTANLGDAIVKFNEFAKSGNVFSKIFVKITDVFGGIIESVRAFVKNLGNAIDKVANIDTSGVESFTDKIKVRFEPFTKLFEGLGKIFGAFGKLLTKLAPIFFALASKIGEAFGQMSEGITNAIENSDFNGIVDMINTGFFATLVVSIKKFFDKLGSVADNAGGWLDTIKGILTDVRGCLQAYQDSLKADILLKIAIAVGVLAASLVAISLIDSEKLTSSLAAVTALFVDLFGAMSIFEKTMGGEGFKSISKVTNAMISLSVAVLILSVAMTTLAKLDWSGIAKGLVGLSGILVALVGFIKATDSKQITKMATGMIAFSVGILILAEAVEKLSKIKATSMIKGLLGMGGIMGVLIGFIKALDHKAMIKGSTSLVVFGAAMIILAESVEKLGSLDLATLGKGLGSVGVIMGLLVGYTKALKPNEMVKGATSIVIFSSAIVILAAAVEKLGRLDWVSLGKGLLGVAAIMGLLVGFMKSVNGSKVTGIAIGLTILGAAMLIFAKAVGQMGGMSWEEIAKGLLSMAGVLGLLIATMYAMPKDIGGKVLAILVMAHALSVLAPVLQTFGSMSLAEIGKGLLTLAGVFVILGVAGYALSGLAPTILMLSAGVALLGVGCAAVGVGIMLFATGLTTLATAGAGAAVAIVAIVSALLGLIPMILQKLGEGIVAFCNVIASAGDSICSAIATVIVAIMTALTQSLPAIFEFLSEFLTSLLDLLIQLTPKLMEWIGVLFTNLMDFLITSVPKIMEFIGVFLDNLIQFLLDYVPKLVVAAIQLIIALLDGIASKLPDVIRAGCNLVIQFVYGLTMTIPQLVDAGFKMIIDFLNGMAKAIDDNNELLIEAVDNLMNSAIEAIKQWFDHFKKSGGDLIDGLIEGIKNTGKEVWDAVTGVAKDAWNAFTDFFDSHSPSRRMMGLGENIDEGLAIGMSDYSRIVSDEALNVGESTVDALSTALSHVSDVVDADMDMNPTIRPVVDLSDVKAGSKQLNGMFDENNTITVKSANKRASAIATDFGTSGKANNQTTNSGTSINFTQNNYSPKSLDKVDIYRQTKNQISTVKGVLNAT